MHICGFYHLHIPGTNYVPVNVPGAAKK